MPARRPTRRRREVPTSRGTVWARGLRVVAMLAGLAVLALSVLTSVAAGRARDAANLDHALESDVGEQAAALSDYFDRARAVDLLLAHNPAFAEFYETPGTRAAKIAAGGLMMREINEALGYLERLYPGRIGEACFIDRSGAEVARVVQGRVARPAELSLDEATNPFFAPTFALPLGRVYQARAYVSPDTHEWVISNSTPLAVTGKPGKLAIVHFEVTLNSFRAAARVHGHGASVSIVDARTGAIWVDSRTHQRVGAPLGRPTDHSLQSLAGVRNAAGVVSLGRNRVAYRRVATASGNANDWYVAVSAPQARAGWTEGFDGLSLALMIAALLTIAVAGTSLRSYQRSLRRAALHDGLTGLPNRTLLADRVEQALRAAARSGTQLAVMILDLDRFKEVNDTLGHHHGDLLLQQVCTRLLGAVRGGDTIARLGGDEFAVLLPDIADVAGVHRVADRMRESLRDSFVVDGVTLDVEASIGIALSPDHGDDAAALLQRADVAMYAAKEAKSGWAVYDGGRDVHTPARLALLGDLRQALDSDDQIVVHYQPKTALALGDLIGVEALVRWQHPVRGMLPPAEFIPVAEGTTLIQRLTIRVLDIALGQVRAWLQEGIQLPVAVNLSARCLHDRTLPAAVFEQLQRHGLDASMLRLEITESSIMTDPAGALAVLRELHDAGIRLSIDDFGTGYSSMAYLKQLPVDELKVDRTFIKDMTVNDSDAMLVRSAIDLGHNLGLTVVAEGVEDQQTIDALRGVDCDVAQGYFLGRPMPARQLEDWLRSSTASVSDASPQSAE